MRYEALINMSKDDKKAAEVLLFMSRCSKATEKIPVPGGMKLLFQLVPKGATAAKVARLVQKMSDDMTQQLNKALDQADAAAERSSRKIKQKK